MTIELIIAKESNINIFYFSSGIFFMLYNILLNPVKSHFNNQGLERGFLVRLMFRHCLMRRYRLATFSTKLAYIEHCCDNT
jgi:hypothetical protein